MAVVAALVAVTGCADQEGSGRADEPVRISIADQGAPGYAPVHIGQELGLFADKGIEVDFVSITGFGPALSALQNDSAQFHTNTITAQASAVEQGAQLQAFCGDLHTTQGAIYARAGDNVTVADSGDWKKAVRDWEGKTIGVFALGGAVELEIRSLAQAAGLDPKTLTFTAVGVGEAAITNLDQGQVDIVYSYPFLTQNLQSRGFEEVLSWQGDLPDEYDLGSVNFMAQTSWLEDNADVAQDFCDVLVEVEETMLDEPDAMRTVLEREYGLKDTVLDLAISPEGPLKNHDTAIDCDDVDAIISRDIESGTLKGAGELGCEDLVWGPSRQ